MLQRPVLSEHILSKLFALGTPLNSLFTGTVQLLGTFPQLPLEHQPLVVERLRSVREYGLL